ncbi:HipA domain-containing protein [Gordonia sp. NPDC003504]
MSLGGAQDKVLLTRVGDDWCTPLDGYPSTHILKPATVWSHSAENEALVMTLARTCRLSDTDLWVESIGGRSTFVTTRYDRTVGEDGVDHPHPPGGHVPGARDTTEGQVPRGTTLGAHGADPA